VTLILCLALLSGCAVQRRVHAFNDRQLAKCEAKYPPRNGQDRCPVLSFPACEQSGFGEVCSQ